MPRLPCLGTIPWDLKHCHRRHSGWSELPSHAGISVSLAREMRLKKSIIYEKTRNSWMQT